jgi:hypothetical protein
MHKLNLVFLPKLPRTLNCLLAVCAIALLTSCSSTHIQGSKTAAGLSAPAFHNVLVVALDDRTDIRLQLESDLVSFFQERKVVAVTSPDRFTLSDFTGGAEEIRKKFAASGKESLLLVRTTDRATFELGPGYERSAGLGEIETAVQLAATLYRLSDGVPMWTGVLGTTLKDQYNSRTVLSGIAKDIVSNLAKEKVIP